MTQPNARVPRLYCRNERVIVPITLGAESPSLVLVAVGAILVGSVHLRFARLARHRRTRWIRCEAAFRRGDELGYFHHGSTIIVLVTPGLELVPEVVEGARVQVGQPLLQHAAHQAFEGGGVASSSSHAPAT